MKISKLFHWLYAILMLMPIFAIGVSCLYVIFNKNAKDSYSGENIYEINYKYQSNVVNSVSDLVIGNIYQLNSENKQISNLLQTYGYIKFKLLSDLQLSDNLQFDDVTMSFNKFTSDNYLYIERQDNGSSYIFTYFYEQQMIDGDYTNSYMYESSFSNNCVVQLINYYLIQENIFSYTDYNVIESVNIDNSGTLDTVFYYSIYQLKNNSLFNWSKDSFLAQPITYITDLFGMDNDNLVIYLLSYWLDISIIWLVFDLVMYVPLVIHRWIDKGVLD